MESLIDQLNQIKREIDQAEAAGRLSVEQAERVRERVVQVAQGIRQRFQAQSENEGYFKAIFERAAIGIAVMTSPELEYTATNPWLQDLLGYSGEELARLRLLDITHPDDLEENLRLVHELTAGQRDFYHLEKRFRRKDGRFIWTAVIGSSNRNSPGQPPTILDLVADVSQRKLQEILKAEQLRVLELIAKGAPLSRTLHEITTMIEEQGEEILASILLLDEQGRVHLGAAPSLPEGYNRAIENEPIGPKAGSCGTAMFLKKTVVTPDIAHDPLWEAYRAAALAYGLRSSWSTPLMATDGRVLGSLAQYYQEPRDPTPTDLHLVDVARHLAEIAIERKAAEESMRVHARELEQVNARLQELDRLKSSFVNLVSHELRTPLTSIRGYAEFLEDHIGGALTQEQEGFVGQIQEGAIRLQVLLDDLLDFARLDAGSFKLTLQETDLASQIRESVKSLRPQALEKGLNMEVLLSDEPLPLLGDPRRIGQILINLIGNALKFTPPGGRITVAARTTASEVRVEVRDNGPGIAQEHLSHLFERFFQVDTTDTRKAGGAGLGLSISKALVEAHGGKIGVETAPGKGSTFWFTLPRKPEPFPASNPTLVITQRSEVGDGARTAPN